MSILKSKKARALLRDAGVPVEVVAECRDQLSAFLSRYLPLFYRSEQRDLARTIVEGKLSGLERKTAEPIARRAGRPRKPVQHFVGGGCWDDEAVMAELQREVGEELADADGVLVLDGSGFPKKGEASCGVARQWCGRLGKVDNCQVGIFAAYAGRGGHAPLDRRLYLPQDWADDRKRRKQCHVPQGIAFQEGWRIALDLLDRCRSLPHGWVAGDDEFGRVAAFRQELRGRGERYLLDVPGNTLVRDLDERTADGRPRAFERAEAWAARQPASRWRKLKVRDGEKGELVVRAVAARVQTKDSGGRAGMAERLLVVRPVERGGEASYALSNAAGDVPLAELVRVKGERHRIEQVFQEAKGEVGLGHYEVRSWVGWHHHMTLSLLALWFLCRQRRRLGKKSAGADRAATAVDPDPLAGAGADARGRRRGNQPAGAA